MNLTKLHKKIIDDGVATFSRPYLSKLIADGTIPFKWVNNKKDYVFAEVVEALVNSKERSSSSVKDIQKKTLHDLPLKKEGQSAKEYKEELVMELGAEPTLADSKIFLTIYQGKIAQQKFDIEARLLVYREDVENKAFIVMRVIRDQMLTLPERLGGELASSTDPKEIKEIMYKEINEVLMFLHEGEALYE